MSFGITDDGFKRKRLEDIQTETAEDFAGFFGDEFDLDPRTPEGQIKALLDERFAVLWEALEAKYFAGYPRSATGVNKDRAVSLVGLGREGALASVVTRGVAYGVLGTVLDAATPIVISVQGNPNSRFRLNESSVISIPAVDEIQKIDFDQDPTSGDFKLTFDGQTTAVINFNDNAAAIQVKLETLSNIGAGNILVAGSITQATGLTITFQNSLGSQNVTLLTVTDNNLDAGGAVAITPSVDTEGSKAKSPELTLTAENTGPTAAPTGTLTVIETPVVGLEDFTNLEDALLGNNQETDAELELRRVQEVQIAGAATPDAIRADILQLQDVTAVVVFFNNSDIVDLDGRPPKSVDIVVEGGDEDQIADAIFATVAAGIGYFGAITKNVTDSQGFLQTIKFSRPDEINIWVELDITIDPSTFPQDQTLTTPTDKGVQDIKDAILAYGEALEIGNDVVVYGSSPSLSCSFQEVPGILGFTLRVGKTASPTTDDNVVISPREIAKFLDSRITVVIV